MEQVFKVTTHVTPEVFRRYHFSVILKNKLNHLRLLFLILYALLFFTANIVFPKWNIVMIAVAACLPLLIFIVKKLHENGRKTEDFERRLKNTYGSNTVHITLSFCPDGIHDLTKSETELIPYSRMCTVSENRYYMAITVKGREVYILHIKKTDLSGQHGALKEFLRSKALEQMP